MEEEGSRLDHPDQFDAAGSSQATANLYNDVQSHKCICATSLMQMCQSIHVYSVLEGGHARASDVPVHPPDAGRHRALQVHHADGRRQLLRPAGRLEAGDRRDPPRDQGEGKGRIYLGNVGRHDLPTDPSADVLCIRILPLCCYRQAQGHI